LGGLPEMKQITHFMCAFFFIHFFNYPHNCSYKPKNILQDSLYTIFDFHYNLFSYDTLRIVTTLLPLYLSTRMIDERVQSYFYCPRHHKNIHQMPNWCFKSADIGLRVILISLSSLAIVPVSHDLQRTAYVFALTLPFTWLGKKLLKTMKTDANLRPHNEYFRRHKKFFGGCPSGHMMEAIYAAFVFGSQHGPVFAIPLSAFAAFLFGDFVSCNRHFVSQLIAGIGLGLMYGIASKKVIEAKRAREWSVNVYADQQGNPYLNVSCEF
jgi:hypothetical protein